MSSSELTIRSPERVHERVVAVSAVARSKQILDQRFEPLVLQPPVQIGEELLLLARSDVKDVVVGPGLLQQREVFLLVCWAGIVEDDDRHGMAIPPEMLVVCLDRRAHVAQAKRRDHERQLIVFHLGLTVRGCTRRRLAIEVREGHRLV